MLYVICSVSNGEYRLPEYPGILRIVLVLEYPGTWFEYPGNKFKYSAIKVKLHIAYIQLFLNFKSFLFKVVHFSLNTD